MLKKIAVAGLVAGGLLAGALTATSAIAARMGGMPGPGAGAHVATPHIAPGGAGAHVPRGAFNHPGPGLGPGPGAHHQHGGGNYAHVHHRRGFGVIVGSGYYGGYYGDYDYGYSGGCEWLHERAIATGSRYWWRRYEACVDG